MRRGTHVAVALQSFNSNAKVVLVELYTVIEVRRFSFQDDGVMNRCIVCFYRCKSDILTIEYII